MSSYGDISVDGAHAQPVKVHSRDGQDMGSSERGYIPPPSQVPRSVYLSSSTVEQGVVVDEEEDTTTMDGDVPISQPRFRRNQSSFNNSLNRPSPQPLSSSPYNNATLSTSTDIPLSQITEQQPPSTTIAEPNNESSQEQQDHQQQQNPSASSTTLVSSPNPTPSNNPPPPSYAFKDVKKDPNQVEIEGTDDPWDPYNKSKAAKWAIVLIISSGAACVTCASSMASSTYTGLENSFHVSQEVATLTVSLFVAGLGCGPLLLGPLSEFIGRRMVYYGSFILFTLFNLPVAFTNNIAVHMIFRFITGFVGSAFLSVAGGTITDIFKNEHVGTPMAVFTLAPFLGPVIGPILAGFINGSVSNNIDEVASTYALGWRWTFYVIIIWSAVETVFMFVFVPETFHPQVLRLKAKHLRKETGNKELYAPIEKSHKSFLQSIAFSCKTPFIIIVTEPMAFLLNLWTSLLLGILYLFFNAFPIVFRAHGFSTTVLGLSFLGIGIGEIIAIACSPLWGKVYHRIRANNGGVAPPEARLVMSMVGGFLVPIGLFWFAFTTYTHVHWIVPIIASAPFGIGMVWVFQSVFTYLVDAYRPVAASAMASNSFMRSSFAAGFPLFGSQMYHHLSDAGASALLAGLSCLMVPLPFIFYRIGARIRANSKFGNSPDKAKA